MKRILILFLSFSLLSLSDSMANYNVSCRAVIFSDSSKLKRLYGKRVAERVAPASTTKVMTALLVLENLPLDRYVIVSPQSTIVQPSKISLKSGEQYTVRDLLYALLLNSANDASVVLAEAVAGSEGRFVEMMNSRAKELGAKHTRFTNSHGLPSKKRQYTTAYDMYLIFRQALRVDFFKKAIKHKYKVISSRAGRVTPLKNHNKILFKGWKKHIYGKTGYTKQARACFVGTLERGNSTLIIAVFGCQNRWDDIKYVVSHFGGVAL